MRLALATVMIIAAWAVAYASGADGDDPYGDIGGIKLLKPEDKIDMKSVPPPDGAPYSFGMFGW